MAKLRTVTLPPLALVAKLKIPYRQPMKYNPLLSIDTPFPKLVHVFPSVLYWKVACLVPGKMFTLVRNQSVPVLVSVALEICEPLLEGFQLLLLLREMPFHMTTRKVLPSRTTPIQPAVYYCRFRSDGTV